MRQHYVACCVALSLATAACAQSAKQLAVVPGCAMSAADSRWIEGALANWRTVEREILLLAPVPLPTVVTFDAQCAYTATPRRDGVLAWDGAAHQGRVKLPDGNVIPARVASFAAPTDSSTKGFFVMALPSIWRAQGVTSGLGLEQMLDVVLLHELMHTRQFYFANPALAQLTRRFKLSDDVNDDALQDEFKVIPAYVADYAAERDVLFAAAAAPDARESKRLACDALAKLRARRARWFVGNAEKWAPLDEIFLTMEGIGQWTAYAWLTSAIGARIEPSVALREVRRDGKHWTQDEGLALFLVIDRHVPRWQQQAFAAQAVTGEALLAQACTR